MASNPSIIIICIHVEENCDNFLRTQYFFIETFPPFALPQNNEDICNHCVLSTVCCGGLLGQIDRNFFFCTNVRVLEVLFKRNVVER